MKTIVLIVALIFQLNILHAQNLPEMPMKNGMIYYSFDHKLENPKKCITYYVSTYDMNSANISSKVLNLSNQLTAKESGVKRLSFMMFPPLIAVPLNTAPECIDTIIKPLALIITQSGDIMWRPAVIELFRKKVIGTQITADMVTIFNSKDSYTLIVKNLTYKIQWSKGLKNGYDIYNISEKYEELKNSGKITKKDIKFFEKLNFFIKSADEMLLKAITETYKGSDL